jgi:hypothetical protein
MSERQYVNHEVCEANHRALTDRLDLMARREDERHLELREDIGDLKRVVTNGLTTQVAKLSTEAEARRKFYSKIQTAVIGLLVVGTGSVIVFVLEQYLTSGKVIK